MTTLKDIIRDTIISFENETLEEKTEEIHQAIINYLSR